MTSDAETCPRCGGNAHKTTGRIELTPAQKAGVEQIADFVREQLTLRQKGLPLSRRVFTLSGIAGAGKTTCAQFAVQQICEEHLGLRIGFLGSTHRARIQLGRSVARVLGPVNTYTVWRAVFYSGIRYFCAKAKAPDGSFETVAKVKRDGPCDPCKGRGMTACGCPAFTRCTRARNHLHCEVYEEPVRNRVRKQWDFEPVDLIWIDEGSMVTQEQMDIITSWGIPVVLTGDHHQLGPVQPGEDDNPLKRMCREMRTPQVFLTESKRQCPASALYRLGMDCRKGKPLTPGKWERSVTVLDASSKSTDKLCDVLGSTEFEPGDQRVVITPWNLARSVINRATHELWYPGVVLGIGERVVARQNGHYGYVVPPGEISSLNPAEYWGQWHSVDSERRRLMSEITQFGVKISDILSRREAVDERELASGDPDRTTVERLRDTMAKNARVVGSLPESRERGTVKHGTAWVEAVRSDPGGDDRVLYVLLRLSLDHGLTEEGSKDDVRMVVRMARQQFGREGSLSETSRGGTRNALWDYGHCITTWAAQGGEWNEVAVLGAGWNAIYRECSYVAVTRAKETLWVCDDRQMTRASAGTIALKLYERVLRGE